MSTQAIGLVRKALTVHASVEHSFAVFTGRMNDWWPLLTHSVAEERAESVTFEREEGGRVYETIRGGEESDWGRVLVWEPPHRFVMTWHPGRGAGEATEVEVRFSADGAFTRVELEHRGWEARGGRAQAVRDGYDRGWEPVLGRFVEAAEQARTPS
jgi:activator of Hsp90 ATPase-like protein